jgi:hypothetical protein
MYSATYGNHHVCTRSLLISMLVNMYLRLQVPNSSCWCIAIGFVRFGAVRMKTKGTCRPYMLRLVLEPLHGNYVCCYQWLLPAIEAIGMTVCDGDSSRPEWHSYIPSPLTTACKEFTYIPNRARWVAACLKPRTWDLLTLYTQCNMGIGQPYMHAQPHKPLCFLCVCNTSHIISTYT